MGSDRLAKAELSVRTLSVVLAAMAALLVELDTQTKTVLMMRRRKATVKDLDALWTMTVITAASAGYHLLQLISSIVLPWLGQTLPSQSKFVSSLMVPLLTGPDLTVDNFVQGATYATFGATMAGVQAALVALVALFGIGSLQWSKLCNIYTRFCEQIAGGLICGVAVTLTMAVAAAISAHRLFRLYSCHCAAASRSYLSLLAVAGV